MSTLVDIANGALIRLGCVPIASLFDTTKEAARCQLRINQALLYVLRHYPWKFAVARVAIPMSSTPPFGFTQAFQLPPDNLRILHVTFGNALGVPQPYKVEGGYIITPNFGVPIDPATGLAIPVLLYLTYVSTQLVPSPMLDSTGAQLYDSNGVALWNISELDPLPYDPMFVDCVSSWLAADLAYDLVQNSTTRDTMLKLYMDQLKQAKSVDSKEGGPAQYRANELSQSRFVYNPYDWK